MAAPTLPIDKNLLPGGGRGLGTENAVLSGILSTVYTAAGIIAVIAIIISGYMYTTSNGNPENVRKAKNGIIYSVIGLVIIFSAATITWFVLGRVK
jgi:type IV secretory pathway VirB2 component (pilin)